MPTVRWMKNEKSAVRKDINPIRKNFEGIVTFKNYCDKKDKFYVYKINDSRGNPDLPSYVFKTSAAKLLMARDMDKDGSHFLNQEFCFFDGKHKRCRNFVTLTASVYHPLLRRQVPLAIMDTESEDSKCISLFWTLLQEALRKQLCDNAVIFNPMGWARDMAGSNLVVIWDVFGAETLKHMKTCEFHFKQNRNKKAALLDTESGIVFKEKCEVLLLAETVDGYTSALHEVESFIQERPAECEFISSWIK